MDHYKLPNEVNQLIVDGFLQGYKNYSMERESKRASMEVSGAYAWTKGNHIDDQIAKLSKKAGILFSIEKAGYSWEYLQFESEIRNEKYLFILKNSKAIEKTFDGKETAAKKDSYLRKYAAINKELFKDIEFEAMKNEPKQISLELSLSEILAEQVELFVPMDLNTEYSRFYIVTYEIDAESKLPSEIKLTLPNSDSLQLMEVEDLSRLIGESTIEITAEDVAAIKNDKESDEAIFSGSANSYDYLIPSKESTNIQ